MASGSDPVAVSANVAAAGEPQSSPGSWPGLSVVIPAYNSQLTLEPLVERLGRVLSSFAGAFEVILVNDGSRDATWQTILDLSSRFPWVRGIDLMRNHGQENALLCGIRLAEFEVIITMDDDLQHPPEEIPRLLQRLSEGYDVVYGNAIEEKHSTFRNLAAALMRRLLRRSMGGAEVAPIVTAFKAFRTDLRNAFSGYRSAYVSIDVLLTWATQSFAGVPVRHEPRRCGSSNYTFGRLFAHAINLISGCSTLPLQAASILGVLLAIVGVVVLGSGITLAVLHTGQLGGVLMICGTVVVVAGLQMLILGIMGEYLSRLYARSMDRPAYVMRRDTRREEN